MYLKKYLQQNNFYLLVDSGARVPPPPPSTLFSRDPPTRVGNPETKYMQDMLMIERNAPVQN